MRYLLIAIMAWAGTSAMARNVDQAGTCKIRFDRMAGTELIDFDTYPDGSPVPEGYNIHDQWRSLGVVFTMGDSSRAAYAVPHWCSLSAPNHVGGDPVVVAWFVDPLTGAPAVTDFVGVAQDNCWGPGEGILMQAFDVHGGLVAEQFNAGPGQFVSFSFPEPIVAKIQMTEYQQGIDNFTFTTPVPAGPVDVPNLPEAEDVTLHPNCPNPFNPRTTVSFTLPVAGPVELAVHDARGRMIARLISGSLPAGAHAVVWDGRDRHGASMPSGTYFCRLTTPWKTDTRKMSLLR